MLSNVGRHHLAVLRCSVVKNPLHKIIAILVTRNVNQRNSSPVQAAFTDPVQISTQELAVPNLQTFLHHLGSKLISAVLSGVTNDVINSPATVWRCAMFADVLDTPVSELSMRNDIDVGEDFLNAGAL